MEQKKPSQKEVELVQLIANDLPQAKIAAELGISVRTVDSRLRKIRATWGLNHLSAICVHFYKKGWIS